MGCQKLKYALKSSSTLPKAQVRCQKPQVRCQKLKYAGAYLKMTAYLRVARKILLDSGFETPIGLPLTVRHHGGFSKELAWAL